MNRTRSRLRGAAWALSLGALCLAGAGCGLGERRDRAAGGPAEAFEPIFRAPLRTVFRVGGIYDIYTITPNRGALAGGNPARLDGAFPNPTTLAELTAATQIYTVYFGDNIAAYDFSTAPTMSGAEIDVIVPPGDALGLVDVIFRDTTTQLDAATLYYGYEYTDQFDIFTVDPNQGPTAGGQSVTISGFFPIAAPITTIAEAYGAYRAYFDGIPAGFDAAFNPVITTNAMYVITPPRTPPGLVDVSVANLVYAPQVPQVRVLPQSYEYLDPFAIIDVIPDRGPMPGGQQVTVIGRFPIAAPLNTIAEAYGAYRVYFDGRQAGFDATFNPVITAGAMYVLTPPGVPPNAPGLVDVSVATMVYAPETPEFRVLPLGYEYIGDLELTSVTPGRGFIFGDEPVTLGGTFPVSTAFSNALLASQASLYYTAYFGYRIAPFDLTVPTPVITPTQMLVRSPPADAVGFVDVRVEDTVNPTTASTLAQAFRYYALYITDIVPDQGPTGGGNGVTIFGLIPAFDSIYSVYEAEQYYTVLFGANVAAFRDNTPNPVIFPSQIDTINRTYTIGYMYVTAPPGAAGFVDVTIQDDLDIDLDAVAPDGYEYIGGDEISSWETAEIAPNPVGKLEAGELLVIITGTGTMANRSADPVFIVPQGGEPDQSGDRIELEEISVGGYVENGGNFTWRGTNKDDIPRIMPNGLLVDGHAAIYILADGGGIIGDDTNDLTDGGVIQPSARDGRHFLIDTVPPRLQLNVGGYLRGDNFVATDQIGNWTLTDLDSMGLPFPSPQVIPHPYDYSGLGIPPAIGPFDAPYDGNRMTRGTNPDSRAQVFFKTSSLTNNFADSVPDADGLPTANLQFTLETVFEDPDIYTVRGMDQTAIDAGRNADFFGGDRRRQVAGFTDGLNLTRAGLVRDEALVNNNEVLIQWDFQSTPFQLPEITGITVDYIAGGPLALGANPTGSPNLTPTPTELRGIFTIGDSADSLTGVQLDDAGVRTLMSVIFRAVDRAGDYTPRLQQTPGTQKLYTRDDTSAEGFDLNQQPETGPLNLWWLRTTATRLTSNIPASGDTRTPSFTWENTGQPDPGAFPDVDDGTGAERLYSFAIYKTDTGLGTRDEQRDGPYDLAVPWSSWDTVSTLTASQVQTLISSNVPVAVAEGVWYLLAVMSVDEAGNLELWPESQLEISAGGGPLTINFVDESGGAEERNWDRWFVPPSGEAVDTRVEPIYWHDDTTDPIGPFNVSELFGRPDASERNFGDAEVVGLPGRATFNPPNVLIERVTGQFRMTMLTDQANAAVEYELIENGVSTGLVVVPSTLWIGNEYTVVIVDTSNTVGFLGSASREPTYYTFRARTFIDADLSGSLDAGEIYDASPATVQFVVVDNVANYIQNRKSEDTQPIQEMDRP